VTIKFEGNRCEAHGRRWHKSKSEPLVTEAGTLTSITHYSCDLCSRKWDEVWTHDTTEQSNSNYPNGYYWSKGRKVSKPSTAAFLMVVLILCVVVGLLNAALK
jgi:hypothetical protein